MAKENTKSQIKNADIITLNIYRANDISVAKRVI
tara:strand:- start:669 stop:770 length:102 start_codon:yes stop_codon:yes gene_type:complete